MPTVVILRCQTGDEEGAVLEFGGEGVVVEELGDGKAVAFDPEFLGEGDCGVRCQAAVGGGGDCGVL